MKEVGGSHQPKSYLMRINEFLKYIPTQLQEIHNNHSNPFYNEELVTLLNYSRNYEGSVSQEVSLKLRTPQFMASLKMLQERRTQRWQSPQFDFKDTQLLQRALYQMTKNNKFARDCKLFDRLGNTYMQASLSAQNQRLSLYQKIRLNDCINVNFYGCLQSQKPLNARDNSFSIYPNYGIDFNINL